MKNILKKGFVLAGLGALLLSAQACDNAGAKTDDDDNTPKDERTELAKGLQLEDDFMQDELQGDCAKAKISGGEHEGKFAPGSDIAAVMLVSKPVGSDETLIYVAKAEFEDGAVCTQNDFANAEAVKGASIGTFLSLNGGNLRIAFENDAPLRAGDEVVIITGATDNASRLNHVRMGDGLYGPWATNPFAKDLAANTQGEIILDLKESHKADFVSLY